MMTKINIKPISVNEAYTGQRFKTPKYKSFKKEILWLLKSAKPVVEKSGYYKIYLEFGLSNILSDWDGSIKQAQDCICEYLGINDRVIRAGEVTTVLVDKGKEYIWFRLEPMELKDLRTKK